MNLFIIEYDDGGEYEQRNTYIIGIYDSLKKASDYAISCGFVPTYEDATYLIRNHVDVVGRCSAHKDYAFIYAFETNVPGEHKDIFEIHYSGVKESER